LPAPSKILHAVAVLPRVRTATGMTTNNNTTGGAQYQNGGPLTN